VPDTVLELCKLICVLTANYLCICVLYHQSRLPLFLISYSFWMLLGITFAYDISSRTPWALLCVFHVFYDINIQRDCHKIIHFGGFEPDEVVVYVSEILIHDLKMAGSIPLYVWEDVTWLTLPSNMAEWSWDQQKPSLNPTIENVICTTITPSEMHCMHCRHNREWPETSM
jgi:hypothetical protein